MAYGETELDRTQSNDQNAGDDGDGALANGLGRAHHTGLPRTHTVPATRVQKRLPEILPIVALIPETHVSLKPSRTPPNDPLSQIGYLCLMK
jgi:hypothetical protein